MTPNPATDQMPLLPQIPLTDCPHKLAHCREEWSSRLSLRRCPARPLEHPPLKTPWTPATRSARYWTAAWTRRHSPSASPSSRAVSTQRCDHFQPQSCFQQHDGPCMQVFGSLHAASNVASVKPAWEVARWLYRPKFGWLLQLTLHCCVLSRSGSCRGSEEAAEPGRAAEAVGGAGSGGSCSYACAVAAPWPLAGCCHTRPWGAAAPAPGCWLAAAADRDTASSAWLLRHPLYTTLSCGLSTTGYLSAPVVFSGHSLYPRPSLGRIPTAARPPASTFSQRPQPTRAFAPATRLSHPVVTPSVTSEPARQAARQPWLGPRPT